MTQSRKLQALMNRAMERGYAMKKRKTETYAIIFDHDFAKALFGEEDMSDLNLENSQYKKQFWNSPNVNGGYADGQFFNGKIYQWHLQQAVISEDPISYIYEAVFGDK